MPLTRYFTFVGGALLVLLLVLDAYFPKTSAVREVKVNWPSIRVYSDRKLPERIVYNTDVPISVSMPVLASNKIVEASFAFNNISPRAKIHEVFAMFIPAVDHVSVSDHRKRQLKAQRHREIVRKRATISKLQMARQAQFGWFGRSLW